MSLADIKEIVKTKTLESYKVMLKNLLPVGVLWDIINDTFWDLLEAFAEELNRIDQRLVDLQNESIPYFSDELLSEWEEVALLEDEKTGGTTAERQAIVQNKIYNPTPTPTDAERRQGPTEQFFTDYAAAINITITSFGSLVPFRVGTGRAGDRLVPAAEAAFVWVVNYTGGTTAERENMKAYFERMKPAHTRVDFNPAIP